MAYSNSTFPKDQDDRIHDDVCRQITWESDIQSQEINVEVKNGAVFLSGRVETCLEKLEAEKAAKAAHGVVSVTNNIQVIPKSERADHEIAHDVVANLRLITSILEGIPNVSVRNGIVMLEGRLRWSFQRQSAEQAAQAIIGVREVLNFINVAPFDLPAPCRQLSRRLNTPSSLTGRLDELQSATSRQPVRQLVHGVIAHLQNNAGGVRPGPRDMGTAMQVAQQWIRAAGLRADGKLVNEIVKTELSRS